MSVSYETIRQWCDKFGATFARRAKAARLFFCRCSATRPQRGAFSSVCRGSFPAPRKIGTAPLCSDPAANAAIPEFANSKHVFVKTAARVQPCREQPSTDLRTRATHAGISRPDAHSGFPRELRPSPLHFTLKRHLLRASLYRNHLAVRFSTWCELPS
ncbi:hypothetical protein B7760_06002 (plasmid) [Burkholderia glumae]|nr:hypothetical protein B7760_06002 [Burkholderia glumae]